MYNKILVAVDRSSIADQVFATSLTLAKALNSDLMLLHVISQESQDSPISYAPYTESYNFEVFEYIHKEWENFKLESERLLKQKAEKAQAEDVNAEFTQIMGDPASSIVEFSKNWGAELIVMGRRGYSGLKEVLLGSVSSYVIHRSHCSVHLVQS